MDQHLEHAINFINTEVYDSFEEIWTEVVGEPPKEYRILIWGSVVDDRERTPNDLDVIIEYTGETIEPTQENSIESWLKSSVHPDNFKHLDPVVMHYLEIPDTVSKSRVSKLYSVDESGWVNYENP